MRNNNIDRALAARKAARKYAPGNGNFTAISDLICDLHHAIDLFEDGEWDAVLQRADMHYTAEVAEES